MNTAIKHVRRGTRARLALALGLLLLSLNGRGQGETPLRIEVEAVEARVEDVASIDGLMQAFYATVNLRPDEPRQWARDRTLYTPWVRFIANSVSADGRSRVQVWDHQQYVEATEPLVRRGFSERELARRTRVYGAIAHVDSSYEGELAGPQGPIRFRGVNSLELYHDGRRWWIASVMWMSEGPQHPIPPDLLPASEPQR